MVMGSVEMTRDTNIYRLLVSENVGIGTYQCFREVRKLKKKKNLRLRLFISSFASENSLKRGDKSHACVLLIILLMVVLRVAFTRAFSARVNYVCM